MALSAEVERILADIKEQNGDDPIDEESALVLYGGKANTFAKLCLRDQLSYALIVTTATRDAIVEQYQSLASRHNDLIEKHKQAVAALSKLGNRKQRRHPWEAR